MFFGKGNNKKNQEHYKEVFFGSGIKEEKNQILILLDYLIDGLLVFDENNRLILINSQAEKFLEVNRKDVLDKSILALNPFKNLRPLVEILGGDIKEVSKKDIQLKENLILEINTVPLMVAGSKIGNEVFLRDVTREKLVERMKSEFVTVAAHQMRTPTSGIKWSLGTLLEGDLGELPKQQKEMIEKAYKTNDRVINLISDLLNVARIEGGKFLSKMILSNVEEVIQLVISDYQDEAKKRKINLGFKKSSEDLPKVMIDVDKIKMAIANLLDNAIRYTLSGGKVLVSLAKNNDDEIEIQIQDTGVGIPENQWNKMFTKFFRGDNITKIETEGTGLGLFITKYIVEAHGGRIWFESEEGKSTTFYLTLPVKERFAEFIPPELY